MLTRTKNLLSNLWWKAWLWRNRKQIEQLRRLFMPEIIEDGKLMAKMPVGPNGEVVSVDLTGKVVAQARERGANDALKLAVDYLKAHPDLKFATVATGRPLRAEDPGTVDLPNMVRNQNLLNLSKRMADEQMRQKIEAEAAAAGSPVRPEPLEPQ